jgi:hypothetical protein
MFLSHCTNSVLEGIFDLGQSNHTGASLLGDGHDTAPGFEYSTQIYEVMARLGIDRVKVQARLRANLCAADYTAPGPIDGILFNCWRYIAPWPFRAYEVKYLRRRFYRAVQWLFVRTGRHCRYHSQFRARDHPGSGLNAPRLCIGY